MKRPFIQRKSSGRMWLAGRTILGLCAAYNHATRPSLLMTEAEHTRADQYARAVKNRLARLGFAEGLDWREMSTGSLWPIARAKHRRGR
jgi:hypothetical protein